MSYRLRSAASLCAAAGVAFTVWAQDTPKKKQLTARQLFYAAVQAPQEEPKAPALKPKTMPKPKTVPAPKPGETAQNGGQPANPPAVPDPGPSMRPPAGAPLGLRYTVQKFADGGSNEVAPDTVFQVGDRVRLLVQASSPGYLYIISQGSSGTWKPIFPSPEVENGDNHVETLHDYILPSKDHWMRFDETKGAEKLFIILSRKPEPDLEKIIYSLQENQPATKTKQLATGAEPEITDATVGRLRKAYARDLIIERVTPDTPGEKKETAVYVVNPKGSSSSRVVADLTLMHR